MASNKKYQAKVYEKDGTTFIKSISESEIRNDIVFKNIINGGQGELVITVNRDFDDFNEGVDIKILNIVKVYESDELNPTPRLIYTGFISQYEPFIQGTNEGVNITCLGLVSLLNVSMYRSGGSLSFSKSGQDPKTIIDDAIDHVLTYYPGLFTKNTDTVGTNVSYDFENQTHRQAVDVVFEASGGGRYWYLDENGQINFKQNPSTATHTFTIAKDIEAISANKSSEDMTNFSTVFYVSGSQSFSDATSISTYGRRESTINDSGIADATTALQVATKNVNDNKDAKIKVTMRINNLYDTETIKPGDTCKIRNVKSTQLTLSDNMQIVGVQYTPDYVILEIDDFSNNFAKELQSLISR